MDVQIEAELMFHFQHGQFARCGPLLRVNWNAFETLDKTFYFAGHLFPRRELSSDLASQNQVVQTPAEKCLGTFRAVKQALQEWWMLDQAQPPRPKGICSRCWERGNCFSPAQEVKSLATREAALPQLWLRKQLPSAGFQHASLLQK